MVNRSAGSVASVFFSFCLQLHGIDCPEKRQASGRKTKQFTSELVFGKTVTVVDPGRGRYSRTVGDVILSGGQGNPHREGKVASARPHRPVFSRLLLVEGFASSLMTCSSPESIRAMRPYCTFSGVSLDKW